MKPIHKFNGGKGATLCHSCGVIIEEKTTDNLYCNKCGIDPILTCNDCAEERRAEIPEGHIATFYQGICGICNQNKTVTQTRDYGKTRNRLKVEKT